VETPEPDYSLTEPVLVDQRGEHVRVDGVVEQPRAITAMSPLQYQKHIRLQEARSLLVARPGDVTGVGHLVGYDSPTQFNREYRRVMPRSA
jgi:methylphosphotriester-DNA--protein-cysteine methyltransferase